MDTAVATVAVDTLAESMDTLEGPMDSSVAATADLPVAVLVDLAAAASTVVAAVASTVAAAVASTVAAAVPTAAADTAKTNQRLQTATLRGSRFAFR
jgi:hypothetical protein